MRIPVTLKIEKSVDRQVELYAAINEKSKSDVFEEAVQAYLKEKELTNTAPSTTCPSQPAQ